MTPAERERELEACAKHFGISVAEFKRRLALEREIKAARARGDEWMVPMLQACDDGFMRDIAMRDNRAPTGPSSAGIIPTSQTVSHVRVPGGGTGWMRETPIAPPPGVAQADRLMDAQDRRDRAELIQRDELVRRAELAQKLRG